MGFTLLPGAPGRVHIHLGCGFGVFEAIPQGASIGAAFLVATLKGVNVGAKGNFRVVIVLGKNPIPVRAFG